MNNSGVVLSSVWGISYDSSSTMFQLFDESISSYMDTHGKLPDCIYVTSSTELSFFTFKEMVDVFYKLTSKYSKIPIKIVSQGCLGLFAVTLEFSKSQHKSVLTWVIEAPDQCVQDGLNGLGIGNLPGQDGLVIDSSYGGFELTKKETPLLTHDDYVIDSCKIVSVSTDLSQQAATILKMSKHLVELNEQIPGKYVSFDVSAPWSKAISHTIQMMVSKKLPDSQWLSSLEYDHRHFMSMKQLFEFRAYKEHCESGSLIMTGLGVGGRFGILRIIKGNQFTQNWMQEPREIHGDFEAHLKYCRSVLIDRKGCVDQQIKEGVLCFQKEYRGIEDLYFSWDVDNSYLERLAKEKGHQYA